MTVIIAIKADNNVYMGCDSAFVGAGQITRRTQSKIVIKDEFLIGMTSNGCKILQILKYKLKLPSTVKIKTEDLEQYLATTFCSKLFKVLGAEGLLVDDTDRKAGEPCMSPAKLIIGVRDRIFEMGEDFDIWEVNAPFHSIGGGDSYALASLEATINLLPQLGPKEHILYALKTASKFVASIEGPYHLIDTGELCLLECS